MTAQVDKAELWRTADALRGSMDASEYKHVVLGLTLPSLEACRADPGQRARFEAKTGARRIQARQIS